MDGVFKWAGWITVFSVVSTVHSVQAATPACFDFSKIARQPLGQNAVFKSGADSASGDLVGGGSWGAVRKRLKMPAARVLDLLRDQAIIKDPKECDLVVTREKRAGYADFQNVDVTIHPLPLISIQWREQWGYVIVQGSSDLPLQTVISYQKVGGTSHIRRFCGTIVVTAEGADATNVSFYEEADASRRTAEDIVKGHLGTIQTLIHARPEVR